MTMAGDDSKGHREARGESIEGTACTRRDEQMTPIAISSIHGNNVRDNDETEEARNGMEEERVNSSSDEENEDEEEDDEGGEELEEEEDEEVDDLAVAAMAAGMESLGAPGAKLGARPSPSLRQLATTDAVGGKKTTRLLKILEEVEASCGVGDADSGNLVPGVEEGGAVKEKEGEEEKERVGGGEKKMAEEEEMREEEEEEEDSLPGLGVDLESDEEDGKGGKGKSLLGPRTPNEALPGANKGEEEEAAAAALVLTEADEAVPCGQVLAALEEEKTIVVQAFPLDGRGGSQPLDEGSWLCLMEGKVVLGRVNEIFGPVTQPCYRLHYRAGLRGGGAEGASGTGVEEAEGEAVGAIEKSEGKSDVGPAVPTTAVDAVAGTGGEGRPQARPVRPGAGWGTWRDWQVSWSRRPL